MLIDKHKMSIHEFQSYTGHYLTISIIPFYKLRSESIFKVMQEAEDKTVFYLVTSML